MRTIEEIKDQVAKDNGFEDWNDLSSSTKDDIEFNNLLNECIKEAQKEAVKTLCDKFSVNLLLNADRVLAQIENL
jgi:hypothetical protein